MALVQYASLPILISLAVLIATCLLIFVWRKNRNLPPGPWGLPFFGYYPFITEPHIDFKKLGKKYGNLFCFRTLGGSLIIILNGVNTMKKVFLNRSDEFIGRPLQGDFVSWFSNGMGIAQEEGKIWKEQRRFFLDTAKEAGIGRKEMEDHILDEISILLKDLRETEGKPTNLKFHVAYTVSSITTQILFSKKFQKDQDFLDIVKAFTEVVNCFYDKRNLLVGFMYNLLTISPIINKERKGRNFLRKIADGIVEEHIQTFDPDHPRDYTDAYLLHRHELRQSGKLDESSFTLERVKAALWNFFSEGTESAGLTVYNMLSELGKHPEVQAAVQKELDNVIGRDRQPSWADRQNLPYTDATIEELYRLKSPFTMTTKYSNFEETELEGYRIPRRSIILGNLSAIHMDPTIYPEPEKFDPHRFLNSEGKRIKREGPYPFGFGKRACTGEILARKEVFLVIVSVIQNFKIFPCNDEETMRVVPRD